MGLLIHLVRNDFKRNRVITTALTVFLILSALLMAGGLRITGTMISSLQGLNELAMPPEYLQMHKGTFDEESFADFVESHDYIKDSQVVKMLNINNANIIIQGQTLERNLMDNGFVIQNQHFDFLLHMDNDIAVVQKGEIGVAIYYAMEIGVKVGDIISFNKGDYRKDLTVSTLIRDAAMNAPLASSKRFLVVQEDLDDLSQNMGEWEYIFEFLLEEDASTATLQKDYIDAGMPSNGAAITGSLVTILNSLSYGLVALIIIAISILLVLMSLLSLSYIIKATLAEENYTIGELKAIGISNKEIQKLYQMKYIILGLVAAVVGYLLAIPFGNFFSASVILYCGEGASGWMKWLYPLMGVVLLSLIVIVSCRRIIGKNLNSTPRQLMQGENNVKKEGHYFLPEKGFKYRNLSIALGELKCKWKEYIVIFLVFVFSTFLILLPMNMRSTIENPSFITYMGVAESDIRIDIQYSKTLVEQKESVLSYLENDPEIEKYAIYTYGYMQLQNTSGEWEYIRVQSGDETEFPLQYLNGKAPDGSQEMALSYMNASDLGKEVGDSIAVIHESEENQFTISGIYQDVTYGGKTAKAVVDYDDEEVEVYIIYLNVADGVSIEDKTDELRSILQESKVTPVSEFVSQTLGGITDYMGMVEISAIVISLFLIMLISVMILRLITAREHSAIAIKKAIGFSNKDIRIQFGLRILMIEIVAIIVGTLLANFLGEAIMGMIFASMGAHKITMLVEPLSAYLLSPLIQICVVFVTVLLGTKVVKTIHIRDQIME